MHVLVVEDHPIMRRVVQLMLDEAGVDGEIVGTGEEAVARVRADTFDVVFMDIGLPGIDGLEAAREIIADGHAPPIWGLTASRMEEELQRCCAAGMVGTLEKPLTAERLRGAVAACRPGNHR
jgi:CheY-like chemotaxis protein